MLKKIDEHFRDKDVLHLDLYTMAFLRGDSVAMQEQITWAASHSDADQAIESAASDTAAYFGRVGAFREYAGKAIDGASPTQQEPAAIFQARKAQWEAELGFKDVAVTDAKAALHRADTPGVTSMAGLALARAGEDRGALSLADELDREFPERSLWRLYWSAAVRASVEINQANPEVAIKILEASRPYEANGYTLVANATLYPAYIRGEAYLALHQAGSSRGISEISRPQGHGGELSLGCPRPSRFSSCLCCARRQSEGARRISRLSCPLETCRRRHPNLQTSQSRVREAAVDDSVQSSSHFGNCLRPS